MQATAFCPSAAELALWKRHNEVAEDPEQHDEHAKLERSLQAERERSEALALRGAGAASTAAPRFDPMRLSNIDGRVYSFSMGKHLYLCECGEVVYAVPFEQLGATRSECTAIRNVYLDAAVEDDVIEEPDDDDDWRSDEIFSHNSCFDYSLRDPRGAAELSARSAGAAKAGGGSGARGGSAHRAGTYKEHRIA